MTRPIHSLVITYKHSGAIVPALWAAYNGMLLVILGALGGSEIPLLLYGSSIGLTEIVAAVMIFARWHSPSTGQRYRLPSRGEAALVGAIGVVLLALGTSLGAWLYPPGGVTLCWALMIEYKDRETRKSVISSS